MKAERRWLIAWATSLAAIQATNNLLARGLEAVQETGPVRAIRAATSAQAPSSFPSNTALATKGLVEDDALGPFSPCGAMPADAVLQWERKTSHRRVRRLGGGRYLDVLGFENDTVSRDDLNGGAIAGYDES